MPERCDRVDQCGDNSDELNCVYPTCNAETEFQCRNFKCIAIANRCNGVIDCQDGNSTDEIGCPERVCNSTLYDTKCPNTNVCIMRRWLCDGDNDCGDSADEQPLFCDSVPCSVGQFRCRDNRCIPYQWVCDGDKVSLKNKIIICENLKGLKQILFIVSRIVLVARTSQRPSVSTETSRVPQSCSNATRAAA